MVMQRLSCTQAVRYRLAVNNLSSRLGAGSYVEAAYAGLQDTASRDALVGMHARVEACEPSAWQDSRLIQTYSPRWAVYVLPADDFGYSPSVGCPATRRRGRLLRIWPRKRAGSCTAPDRTWCGRPA
jgi:hypothetical protein